MSPKEVELFLEHWKQVRRKGVLLYILPTALSWGTFMVVFLRLFMALIDQGISLSSLRNAFWNEEFLVYWGVFLIGGLAYAITLWFYYNWRFRKLSARQKPDL